MAKSVSVQPGEPVESMLDEAAGAECGQLVERVDEAVEQVRRRGRRGRSAQWLRQLGLDVEPGLVRLATGFRCGTLGTTLRTDCQLRQCRYHIDYEWTANCLLAYMHQQQVESLSVDEVSFLYRIPAERVKQKIEEATVALRTGALEQQRERDDSLSRQFRYLLGARLCCVCESPVGDEPVARNLQVERIGAFYCSRECRDEKPPRVVELEVEKGLWIGKILQWTFRRYGSLSLAEQALQMPRWLVYEASRRYLNEPIESFFPALQHVQNQRRSALIRRTWHTPKWVESLTRRLQPLVTEAKRFGAVHVQTAALRRQLSDVLDNV
jgi:hypothetical protein